MRRRAGARRGSRTASRDGRSASPRACGSGTHARATYAAERSRGAVSHGGAPSSSTWGAPGSANVASAVGVDACPRARTARTRALRARAPARARRCARCDPRPTRAPRPARSRRAALVVGDDQHRPIGRRMLLAPAATIRSASMSRPESVSSRIARRGSRIAIWRISLRFFSPPEKPSLTERVMKLRSISTSFIRSVASARKSMASRSSRPRARRTALSAVRRKDELPTPGISTGCWNARNTPAAARSSGFGGGRSSPSSFTEPATS